MDNSPKRTELGVYATKHGLADHKWYPIWRSMVARCYNESSSSYPLYGGRGIDVCSKWRDEPSVFIQWLTDNGYTHDLQVDRIDNDAGYGPENCRVVSGSTNSRNRRDNRRYSVLGEMLLSCEVEERYGIKAATFRARVENYGWDENRAATQKTRASTRWAKCNQTHVSNL